MATSRIIFIFLIALAPLRANALFFTTDFSAWQAWDALDRTISEPLNRIADNTKLMEVYNLVKLYGDTKDLTGDVLATFKDIQSFKQKIELDLKGISGISRDHQSALNSFFSWKSTLSGNNGNSMLKISNFYNTVTNEFRDENGNLNLASTVFAYGMSDEYRLQKTRTWNSFSESMRRVELLYHDNMFQEKMNLAKLAQMESYKDMVILNLEVFRTDANQIKERFNAIGNAEEYYNEKKTGGEFKGTLTENEISIKRAKALESQLKSSQYISEAFEIFQRINYLEMQNQSMVELNIVSINAQNSSATRAKIKAQIQAAESSKNSELQNIKMYQ